MLLDEPGLATVWNLFKFNLESAKKANWNTPACGEAASEHEAAHQLQRSRITREYA